MKNLIKQIVRLQLAEMDEKRRRRRKKELGGRPRKDPDTPLAKYIEKRGGSDVVAKQFGISRQHLDKLARNDTLPSLEVAVEIASAIGEMPPERWEQDVEKKD